MSEKKNDFFEKVLTLSPEKTAEIENLVRNECPASSEQEVKNLVQELQNLLQKYAEMEKINKERENLEEELKKLEEEQETFIEALPNILNPEVPEGKSEEDNVEIKKVGDCPNFSFPPKAHFELANTHHLDFSRAEKISGARFSLMRGEMARLERALINFFLDENKKRGYEEISHPTLVHSESLFTTGQLPKFEEDLFRLSGEHAHLFLSPTSEVPLTNIYRNEKINKDLLPFHFCAVNNCYRSEAGAAGRDTKGLMRLHEFKKVELVKITLPEESEKEHQKMLEDVENLLQKLELPYRIVLLCAGDTGFSAAKCYDFEAWIPSQNKYREISSCSNCGEFQARRGNIRSQAKDKSLSFPHTLNGSALAVGRAMIALLENHQQKDGSIRIPRALQNYLNGDGFIFFDGRKN